MARRTPQEYAAHWARNAMKPVSRRMARIAEELNAISRIAEKSRDIAPEIADAIEAACEAFGRALERVESISAEPVGS